MLKREQVLARRSAYQAEMDMLNSEFESEKHIHPSIEDWMYSRYLYVQCELDAADEWLAKNS